jgi:glycosyltransferase involved in cell wall biosynthesis
MLRAILRVAVLWPRPRRNRWRLGQELPADNPDQSDALLYLEDEGFRVSIEDSTPFPINPLARMHEMWSGLDPARTARLLLRYRRYDLVVGVGAAVAFFLVQLRRLLRLRLPIVLIDPALNPHYARRKRLQDRVLPYIDKVIVFGQVQLDYLREVYGDRVDAVFLPIRIDTDFYCPGHTPPAPDGKPYVLSVGGDLSRDFATLVKAVQVCRSWGRHDFRCLIKTHLPVAAEAPGVEVLRDQVSWTDLRELYRGAAVVALPLADTVSAGGITTLLEAMAVGRPVVTSASRGIRDYVKDGDTALVVPTSDPEAMARAILQTLDNRATAEQLGRNARNAVVERCANRVYAHSLADILREVLRTCETRRLSRTY